MIDPHRLTLLRAQLYETEAKRRMKKDPAITFELTAGNWFPAGGEDAKGEEPVAGGDKISHLWTFS